jgi:PhoPQ-activated pathogenicity-related protein
MIARRTLLLTSICLALTVPTRASGADQARSGKTPLDDYIARPDPTYSWKVVNTIPGDGCTTFVIDLKSQTWRSVPEVDRPVWQHWLVIVKPAAVKHDTAFLSIGGGKNDGKVPAGPSPQSVRFATATGSVVAELRMIPNQPLVFNADGKPRSEDDLIAYCWIKSPAPSTSCAACSTATAASSSTGKSAKP